MPEPGAKSLGRPARWRVTSWYRRGRWGAPRVGPGWILGLGHLARSLDSTSRWNLERHTSRQEQTAKLDMYFLGALFLKHFY